ncbi:MAG: hypothetical protein V1748_08430 [Actinomycetota bacterium]
MEQDFRIGDAVSFGWEQFKENLGFYIAVVLIIGIAGAIPNFFTNMGVFVNSRGIIVTFGIVFGILAFIVGVFQNMAQTKIGLTACDQKPADFTDLYSQYKKFLDMLVGSILYFLIVLGGLILLIVPGIYWAVKYHFWGYLIIDQGMSPVDAIKKSGQMTKGHWWHLFLFFLAMFGLGILGFLACCIGIFVTAPIIMISIAYIYRWLLAASGTTAVMPPEEFAAPPPAVPPTEPPAPQA